MHRLLLAASAWVLAACAAVPGAPLSTPTDILLLGEQHDAPTHQQLHHQTVQALAGQGRLAALALEMAERGTSTAGLPRQADPGTVRQVLRWNDQAWPWDAYGPAVMAAVAAGVPVLGANLPREQMRASMADVTLDAMLDTAALQAQQEAIRDGHCGLLPPAQITPMTRVQIARDRAMAATLAGAAQPGKTVVLVAGAGHVDAQLGVPRHLPPHLSTRSQPWPGQPSGRDHCAELRQRMQPAG